MGPRGIGPPSFGKSSCPRIFLLSRVATRFKSAPAQKAPPSPQNTATSAVSSLSKARNASQSACACSGSTALRASGREWITVSTRSLRSTRTGIATSLFDSTPRLIESGRPRAILFVSRASPHDILRCRRSHPSLSHGSPGIDTRHRHRDHRHRSRQRRDDRDRERRHGSRRRHHQRHGHARPPWQPIPPGASAIHHIIDEDLKDAPPLSKSSTASRAPMPMSRTIANSSAASLPPRASTSAPGSAPTNLRCVSGPILMATAIKSCATLSAARRPSRASTAPRSPAPRRL